MKFFTKIKVITEDTNPAFTLNFNAWRWEIELRDWGVFVSAQARRNESYEWRFGYGYYNVFLAPLRKWELKREHGYYDGPHDCLVIGPLWIAWQGAWCDKCYNGE